MKDDLGNDIPAALYRRPRFGNHVIPYTTFVGPDGRPDFRVLDTERQRDCLDNRKCGLCGSPIKPNEWVVFIGGPKCVKQRLFADPGMHEACARYAAKVCPYLADLDARHRMGGRPPVSRDVLIVTDPLTDGVERRPSRMALYFCKSYAVIRSAEWSHAKAHNHPKRIVWDAMPGTPGR